MPTMTSAGVARIAFNAAVTVSALLITHVPVTLPSLCSVSWGGRRRPPLHEFHGLAARSCGELKFPNSSSDTIPKGAPGLVSIHCTQREKGRFSSMRYLSFTVTRILVPARTCSDQYDSRSWYLPQWPWNAACSTLGANV